MNKKITIGVTVAILAMLGLVILTKVESEIETDQHKKAEAITHGHGLAVDVADSNKVYIATHEGIVTLINDKDLYEVAGPKDDYMGFSVHPTQANVFFSSGHSSRGGNIGFQKSEDGGITWKKLSNGVNGPVDFHESGKS
jgi:hypothetical protein